MSDHESSAVTRIKHVTPGGSWREGVRKDAARVAYWCSASCAVVLLLLLLLLLQLVVSLGSRDPLLGMRQAHL